jgi:hypothetical protein
MTNVEIEKAAERLAWYCHPQTQDVGGWRTMPDGAVDVIAMVRQAFGDLVPEVTTVLDRAETQRDEWLAELAKWREERKA